MDDEYHFVCECDMYDNNLQVLYKYATNKSDIFNIYDVEFYPYH